MLSFAELTLVNLDALEFLCDLDDYECSRLRVSRPTLDPAPAMVVKIRLARFGKRNAPFYNIVVAQARYRRDCSPTAHAALTSREGAHETASQWKF